MIALLLILACPPSKPDPEDSSTSTVDSADTDTDPTDSVPTTPDLDQDNDGYETPDDCDDTRTAVHPGAEEVPGNGVDEDCDGADLPDADGDFYGDAAFGGDDCDDSNAWVHPGATEYCDPLDQDCDGAAIAPGGCEGLQEPKAYATWVFEDSDADQLFRDLDGDGLGEVVGGSGGTSLSYDGETIGPAWAIYTGLPTALPVQAAAMANQVVTSSGGRSNEIDAGDVTGDGVPDLAVFGVFMYAGWVIPGPLPMDGTLIDAWDSDLVWEGAPRHPDEWCWQVILGGDLDGDGVNDALCNTQDYDGQGTFEFFRGGQFGASAMETIYGSGIHDPDLSLLPDLDGDGANELGTATLIINGASVAAGVDMMDSVIVTFPLPTYYLSGVADRTGDGVPELTFATEDACVGSTYGSVYVFDGTVRGNPSLTDALGCFVGSEDVGIAGGGDIDVNGDGEQEFLLLGTGYTAIATPVLLPTWGEPVLDWGLVTGPMYIRSGTSVNNIGNVDLPGTGDDILFFIPNNDAEDGNSYLYPGWDVPWFDRTYWPDAE